MLGLFRSRFRVIVGLLDAVLFGTIVFLASHAVLGWERVVSSHRLFDAATITLVAVVSLYYHGLYECLARTHYFVHCVRMVLSLFMAGVVVWLVLPWTLEDGATRSQMLLTTFVLAAIVLPPVRLGFVDWWTKSRFHPPLLILGSGPLATACRDIAMNPESGFRYVGCVVPEAEAFLSCDNPDIVGTFAHLQSIFVAHDVRHVVVCQSDRRGKLPVMDLLDWKFGGVEIEEGADFYEKHTGRVFAMELRPSQLVFADGYRMTRRTLLCKRWLDVFGATAGLLLASPLMLIAAIAIKWTSRGPVFYSQERLGLRGKHFSMHKFRSMRVDAEVNGLPQFASENDPRITTIGRFLRRTRIDELPQLWNVLRGDMSLVGPRPERPAFVAQFEQQIPYFRQRLFVKPGVTGHAQVRCRYSAALEDHQEKLEHDLFYIKNMSIVFDLSILIDTVKVVLLRIGSR